MSLWIFFSECRYSRPLRISRRMVAICVSSRAPGSIFFGVRSERELHRHRGLTEPEALFLLFYFILAGGGGKKKSKTRMRNPMRKPRKVVVNRDARIPLCSRTSTSTCIVYSLVLSEVITHYRMTLICFGVFLCYFNIPQHVFFSRTWTTVTSVTAVHTCTY